TSRRGEASTEELAFSFECLLVSQPLFVHHGDEAVNLVGILGVVADGRPDPLERHADPVSEGRQEFFATLGRSAGRGNTLPDVRTPEDDGTASRRPGTENDAGVALQAKALVDVALGQSYDRLPTL